MKIVCEQCNEECATVCVDLGIGAYAYGDGSYTHSDYQDVSECCGGDFTESEE